VDNLADLMTSSESKGKKRLVEIKDRLDSHMALIFEDDEI